jgi:hypothetical protein
MPRLSTFAFTRLVVDDLGKTAPLARGRDPEGHLIEIVERDE